MSNEPKRFHVILRYGVFSYSTMTQGFRDRIRIPKPLEPLSVYEPTDKTVGLTKKSLGVLVFEYKNRLSEDVIEYSYVGEE